MRSFLASAGRGSADGAAGEGIKWSAPDSVGRWASAFGVDPKTMGKLLAKQAERFARDGAKPWELAAADPAHPPELPPGVSASELAAWTAVSRVLLNLDETITKE